MCSFLGFPKVMTQYYQATHIICILFSCDEEVWIYTLRMRTRGNKIKSPNLVPQCSNNMIPPSPEEGIPIITWALCVFFLIMIPHNRVPWFVECRCHLDACEPSILGKCPWAAHEETGTPACERRRGSTQGVDWEAPGGGVSEDPRMNGKISTCVGLRSHVL